MKIILSTMGNWLFEREKKKKKIKETERLYRTTEFSEHIPSNKINARIICVTINVD